MDPVQLVDYDRGFEHLAISMNLGSKYERV